MPKINLEQHQGNHFGFSAVGLHQLGASAYTLVNIVVDDSGSTSGFSRQMEDTIDEIIRACSLSSQADNLLVRVVKFSSKVTEVHGFTLLNTLKTDEYNNILHASGMTALNDAVMNALDAVHNYGSTLGNNHYTVNSVNFVITDGVENDSTFGISQVKDKIENTRKNESLESITNILIGLGDPNDQSMQNTLSKYKTDSGMDEFVWMGAVNAKSLGKLGKLISQSISKTSSSLGQGSAPSLTI